MTAPRRLARRVLARRVLGPAALGLLAAAVLAVLPAGAATHHRSLTASTRKGAAPACAPSNLQASLALYEVGTSSSSPAGAVVLQDTAAASCTLRGVPTVRVVSPTGSALGVTEVAAPARRARTVTLVSHDTAQGTGAGASITWSSWGCPTGSFDLTVKFPGWSSALTTTAHSGTAPSGTGTCTGDQQTIYVGPVAAVPVAPLSEKGTAPAS